MSTLSSSRGSEKNEETIQWAAVERLPFEQRTNFALLRSNARAESGHDTVETVDVRKLSRSQLGRVVANGLDSVGQDNLKLLSEIKQRIDVLDLELPKIEVRFENLEIKTNVQIGSRSLPTLLNFYRDMFEGVLNKLRLFRPQRHKLTILKSISGVIKPGRMTLLLGPPGAGKSTLLKALAGIVDSNLNLSGTITYNGHKSDEFFVRRACSYVSQIDNHTAEMTVRETLEFAAECLGNCTDFSGYMEEIIRLEEENNIRPHPEIDAYMKASSVSGKKHSVATEYALKILGLDVCSDTLIGNDMLRGVSGGQKKRVTTGEMVVGPRKTILMDEISTGLDSSTTFLVVNCIRNFVHLLEGTVLMSLLQPAPETFDLFDDLIILSEGFLIYQGPRSEVLEFFESLGFRKPRRKNTADYLQEVTSKKDQAQYWGDPSKPYRFIPVSKIAEEFQRSRHGQYMQSFLSNPYDKSRSHPLALPKTKYSVPRWELVKACFNRELLLIDRNRFLYVFKVLQIAILSLLASTSYIRTRVHPVDVLNGQLYLSCLFFSLTAMLFNGSSELPLTIGRLTVFYKQRDNLFHPAWAWSIANCITRIPYSLMESLAWALVMYFCVGYAPGPARFFRFVFLLLSLHQMALGLFRMIASLTRDHIVGNTWSTIAMMSLFLLGGYVIPKDLIKPWWIWGYWASGLTYAQRAVAVNEFTATRWTERLVSGNVSLGKTILNISNIPSEDYWYWIGIGVLFAYALVFNCVATIALTFLDPRSQSQTVVLPDDVEGSSNTAETPGNPQVGSKGMILPFQPLAMTFYNVNYHVDMPKEMRSQGVSETRLQLLSNVSGAFSPGVLTALMGSSGAGKTTLLDVLSGRKTSGYITGDIRISGYPKEQNSFARISGYVEQNDVHSPQLTVHESLLFSSYLRLPKEVDEKQRKEFVEEVMQLVELDTLRYALVGLPGITGLSTEQRKRLTIAVELVANPSIIFMDEPTSGLDARAAAIVMRAVRNTVDTGRTVVCTIHQPSVEIFEAFDELLLLKRGGKAIYGGKLGENSQTLINYFHGIPGVKPFPDGYNPANWMLEVTTPVVEEAIAADFSTIYLNSEQYRDVEASIKRLSVPPANSEPLKFTSTYAKDLFSQFKMCLWKQNLVYWRQPEYNGVKMIFTTITAIIIGSIFWDVGSKRDSTKAVSALMGSLYVTANFLGINNGSSVQPIISVERTVFYREKGAGMYSPISLSLAQGVMEIPYLLVQTIIYCVITYFMINYERTIGKLFMYILYMFLTFLLFTLFGLMSVGVTPTLELASVYSGAFYAIWNLFSGFLIPVPNIPPWWKWLYYICPVAWSLRGIITSQLGDVETMIEGPEFEGRVRDYIKVRFDFGSNMAGATVGVLIGFSVVFFSVYVLSVKVLNFQRR